MKKFSKHRRASPRKNVERVFSALHSEPVCFCLGMQFAPPLPPKKHRTRHAPRINKLIASLRHPARVCTFMSSHIELRHYTRELSRRTACPPVRFYICIHGTSMNPGLPRLHGNSHPKFVIMSIYGAPNGAVRLHGNLQVK